MKIYLAFLTGVTISVFGGMWLNGEKQEQLGAFSDPFLSIQLSTTTATAGYVLKTTGLNNYWDEESAGGSGATTDGGQVTYVTDTSDDFAIGGTATTAPFYFDSSAGLASTTDLLLRDDLLIYDDINFNDSDVIFNYSSNQIQFTGAANGYIFDGSVRLNADDNGALGLATTGWSDLFLASGGVINWNNGDVTLTHASNLLTFSGGGFDAGAATSFEITSGSDPTINAAGEIAVNTDGHGSLDVASSTSFASIPLAPPISFFYSSTSWTGTTTFNYPTSGSYSEVIYGGVCNHNGSTTIRVTDGTNHSNTVSLVGSATTSVTFTTNNRFVANGEIITFQATGDTAGELGCSFDRKYGN